MRRPSKKLAAIIAGTAIVAVGGGVALAYWTSAGSGDGIATTSTSNTTTTVNQVSVPTNMAPGVAASAVTFNVTNNSSTQRAYVTNVVVSISSVTGGSSNPLIHTCDATDYTLTAATWTPVDLPASGTSADNATATLGFTNNPTLNQDNCQGAVVHLHYVSS